jgi:hypothetical protein
MKQYITEFSYPVIVGGTSVSHCVPSVTISDIDIVFALVPENPSAVMVQTVMENRDKLIHDIIHDPHVSSYNLGVRETYKNHPEYAVSAIKLVRLTWENDVIFDTSVQSAKTNRVWNFYSKFIGKQLVNPIPYKKENGVLYATCGFAKYDALRILLFSIEAGDRERIKKYLNKYVALAQLGSVRSLAQLRKDPDTLRAERRLREIISDFKTNVIISDSS